MRKAIFRLDEQYREPLVLQVMMGHTAKEIAAVMEIRTGAVLTRLHRARAMVRAELQGADSPDDVNE